MWDLMNQGRANCSPSARSLSRSDGTFTGLVSNNIHLIEEQIPWSRSFEFPRSSAFALNLCRSMFCVLRVRITTQGKSWCRLSVCTFLLRVHLLSGKVKVSQKKRVSLAYLAIRASSAFSPLPQKTWVSTRSVGLD